MSVTEIEALQQNVRQLELQISRLKESNRRSFEENDILKDEIKNSSSNLSKLQTELRGTRSELSTFKQKEITLQVEINQLRRDLEKSNTTKKLYEDDSLKDKEALNKFRSNLRDTISDLESKLKGLTTESEKLNHDLAMSKGRAEIAEQEASRYKANLEEMEQERSESSSRFSKELAALKQVSEVFKRNYEESNNRLQELEKTLNTVESRASDAENTLNAQLQEALLSGEKRAAEVEVEMSATIKELESELKEVKTKQDQSHIGNAENSNGTTSNNASITAFPQAFESLSVIEMYDRVVAAEKQMNIDRSHRQDIELQLNRATKDLESKSSVITKLQNDYQRVVEAQVDLSKQLEESARALRASEEKLQGSDEDKKHAEIEMESLKLLNKDLSSQLQHLLKANVEKSVGRAIKPPSKGVNLIAPLDDDQNETVFSESIDEIISTNLVTFDDIIVMQTKNAKLLQTVRSLSQEQVLTLQAKDDEKKSAQKRLHDVLSELEDLRRLRRVHEDMLPSIATITQQRDAYKILLDEAEAAKKISAQSSGSPSACSSNSSEIRDLHWKIQQLENNLQIANDHIERFTQADAAAKQALEIASNESSELRRKSARYENEVAFQKSRVERLEQMLKETEGNLNKSIQRKAQAEGILLSQQRITRQKEMDLVTVQEQVQSMQNQINQLQVDLEAANAAEKRLSKQIAEKEADLVGTKELYDTMSRIEASMSSKAQTELSLAALERDGIQRELESVKKELSEYSLIAEERIKALETDAKSNSNRAEELGAEVSDAREKLATQEGLAKSSQERSDVLQRELGLAHERIAALQGKANLDGAATADVKQKEKALHEALTECEGLKQQLLSANEHAEKFKKLNEATDATMKDLQRHQQEIHLEHESRTARLSADIEKLSNELITVKQQCLAAETQVDTSRIDFEAKEREFHIQLREAEATVKRIVSEKEAQVTRNATLLDDISKFQNAAHRAQTDYEREVQRHAEASKMRQDTENEKTNFHMKIAELKASLESTRSEYQIDKNKWESERVQLQNEKEFAENQFKDSREQKEFLNTQVQELLQRVENMQNDRVTDAEEQLSEAEASNLRRSVVEMQEANRFLKTEKETIESRLQLSETESARLGTELESTLKRLEVANAEITLKASIIEKQSKAESELQKDTNQLDLLRESNQMLRSDNEELQGKVTEMETTLKKNDNQREPLQLRLRTLESESQALGEELESAKKNVAYWQDRTQQLVARYNDIDPAEHTQLQKLYDDLLEEKNDLLKQKNVVMQAAEAAESAQEEAETLAEQREAAVKEITDQLSKAKAEVETLKFSVSQSNANLQRASKQKGGKDKELSEALELVVKLKEELSSTKELAESAQEAEKEATESLDETLGQLSSAKEELTTANNRLEQMKARAKAYKKQLDDLNSASKGVPTATVPTTIANTVATVTAVVEPAKSETQEEVELETESKVTSSSSAENSTGVASRSKRRRDALTPAEAAVVVAAVPELLEQKERSNETGATTRRNRRNDKSADDAKTATGTTTTTTVDKISRDQANAEVDVPQQQPSKRRRGANSKNSDGDAAVTTSTAGASVTIEEKAGAIGRRSTRSRKNTTATTDVEEPGEDEQFDGSTKSKATKTKTKTPPQRGRKKKVVESSTAAIMEDVEAAVDATVEVDADVMMESEETNADIAPIVSGNVESLKFVEDKEVTNNTREREEIVEVEDIVQVEEKKQQRELVADMDIEADEENHEDNKSDTNSREAKVDAKSEIASVDAQVEIDPVLTAQEKTQVNTTASGSVMEEAASHTEETLPANKSTTAPGTPPNDAPITKSTSESALRLRLLQKIKGKKSTKVTASSSLSSSSSSSNTTSNTIDKTHEIAEDALREKLLSMKKTSSTLNPTASEFKPTSPEASASISVSAFSANTPLDTIETQLKESDAAAIAKLRNDNPTDIDGSDRKDGKEEEDGDEDGAKKAISLSSTSTISLEERARRRAKKFSK